MDYKTGKAPGPRYVGEALYQMRFYALLLARTQVLPSRMQLVYLRAGQVITLDPTAEEIHDFERQIDQLWDRIERDIEQDSFAPRKIRCATGAAYVRCARYSVGPLRRCRRNTRSGWRALG